VREGLCLGDSALTDVASPSSPNRLRRLALPALAIVLVAVAGRILGGYLPGFAAWVESLGALGPVVFIAGYVLATILLAPGAVLTLAAGAIFGVTEGVLYVFAAATAGACGAFLVARHLLRDLVRRRVAHDGRFGAIERAVAEQGFALVFLLRLSPLFPFNLLNYALGVTGVRFRDYALASVGMLPGTVLYVYYGRVAGDVASALAGNRSPDAAGYALLATGLIATVVATTLITRKARRALGEITDG
jgi:uncharacterized membrane protein YdjX (TVP38/TMEM64 family)